MELENSSGGESALLAHTGESFCCRGVTDRHVTLIPPLKLFSVSFVDGIFKLFDIDSIDSIDTH